MKVAFDATAILNGNTGVAHYAAMVWRHLEERHPVEIKAFGIGRGSRDGWPMRHVPVPLRVTHAVWRRVAWPPAELITGPVDLVHSIDMIPPPTRGPLVMTIHDLLPLVIPEHYAPRYIEISKQQLAATARATVVVADCHATKDQIIELSGVPESRVVVAPLGFRPPAAVVPSRLIAEPYVLAVGAVTPRKGFLVLADAVAQAEDELPLVVIAGPDGVGAEQVHQRVADLGLGGRVRLLGRVDDEALESLYRHAEVVCHPSLAEGFGIPCLEAMGYGVPLVAADIPQVREITGGVAELVNPGDAGALAAGLSRVLRDDALSAQMSTAGRERAAGFTWERTAELVFDAYQQACS